MKLRQDSSVDIHIFNYPDSRLSGLFNPVFMSLDDVGLSVFTTNILYFTMIERFVLLHNTTLLKGLGYTYSKNVPHLELW